MVENEFVRKAKTRGSICYISFLVQFIAMASQTGREIMNCEVAGSIVTVFAAKRKKRDFFTFKKL